MTRNDFLTCAQLAELFNKLRVDENEANTLLLRAVARIIISIHDGDRQACEAHGSKLADDLKTAIVELRTQWLLSGCDVADPSPLVH